LNLRVERDQLLASFFNPGFFKEVRAFRVYRRICDGHAVVCMHSTFVALIVHELKDHESECGESGQRQYQFESIGR
jgi:hypothetical protein